MERLDESFLDNVVEDNLKSSEEMLFPRVLVFVFPQFHKDSLNDYLWGKGFTDWESLRKAPKKK